MSYGVEIRDSSNRLTFASLHAAGGVCLGIYSIPNGGAVFTFPDMGPGLQGVVVSVTGVATPNSFDNTLGYPRFTFQSGGQASPAVALFVK